MGRDSPLIITPIDHCATCLPEGQELRHKVDPASILSALRGIACFEMVG